MHQNTKLLHFLEKKRSDKYEMLSMTGLLVFRVIFFGMFVIVLCWFLVFSLLLERPLFGDFAIKDVISWVVCI